MSGPSHGSPVCPALCHANRQFVIAASRATASQLASSCASYGSSHVRMRTGRLWALKTTHVSSRSLSGKSSNPSRTRFAMSARNSGCEMPALDERELHGHIELGDRILDVLPISTDAHA